MSTGTATDAPQERTPAPATATYRTIAGVLGTGAPVYALLIVLLVALAATDPGFYEPDRFLAFVKRAAPLVILAAGQYLVIVCGEFDLSVGAIVTAGVVAAAEVYGTYPDAPWALMTAGLLLAGAAAGLLNGLITTVLRVPSFITTLGMMLILEGAVFYWTGGSPQGRLPEDFRRLGRDTAFGWLPWAVLACVVAGVLVVLLMRSDFGRTLVATGDSERAAHLAGCGCAGSASSRSCCPVSPPPSPPCSSGASPGCPRRRAAATSSRRSPPSCSAGSHSAAGAAASSPRWRVPSRCRRCSRSSTSRACPGRWSPPSRASSSSPPWGSAPPTSPGCAAAPTRRARPRPHHPHRPPHRAPTGRDTPMTRSRSPRPRRRPTAPTAAAVLATALLAALTACSSDAPAEAPAASGQNAEQKNDSGDKPSKFFDRAEYDRQLTLSGQTPKGPAARPWEQMLAPKMADTARYRKKGEADDVDLCFSNAGVFNPWRQVGLKNMKAEVELHDEIDDFTVLDAQGKDDKQISDIQELAGNKDCDALIVSPNTTATLTPR
ncbi:hypothetical protein SMD44_00675 [Streptomyces alboflavus]|uniref:Autoinducer 2 import system permease protein LsrD n=1 Tax=Streptomyces alboflavus TaxID=67267 RepID=A0A1Z1W4F3_9ACTN|nr:hypothetical protein SMD44_00675 [Streptomyces alboflavus]